MPARDIAMRLHWGVCGLAVVYCAGWVGWCQRGCMRSLVADQQLPFRWLPHPGSSLFIAWL